jgi:hypothetical protein
MKEEDERLAKEKEKDTKSEAKPAAEKPKTETKKASTEGGEDLSISKAINQMED